MWVRVAPASASKCCCATIFASVSRVGFSCIRTRESAPCRATSDDRTERKSGAVSRLAHILLLGHHQPSYMAYVFSTLIFKTMNINSLSNNVHSFCSLEISACIGTFFNRKGGERIRFSGEFFESNGGHRCEKNVANCNANER